MSSRAERFRGPIFESSLEPEPLSQKRYFNRGRGASALPANDSFSFTADSRGGAIFNDPMASGGVGERSTSTASDARRWWQFQSQVQSNTDASRPSAQAASAASAKEGRPIFSASDRAQFASSHYPHVDDAATATACDATRSSSSFCYSDVVRASRAVPLSKFAEAALVAGSGAGAAESTWTRPTGKQLPSDSTAYARPGADAAGLVSSHFESRYERPGTTFASASHLPGAATRTGPAVTPGDVASDIVLSPPSAHALAASNVKMAGQRAFLDEFLRQFHSRRRTAAISASGLPSFEDRRFSPDQPVALGERHNATHATHHSPPRPLVRWNWARPGAYEDGGGTSSAAYSGVGFAFLPLPEDASPRSAAARADPLGDLFIQAARCLDETPGIAGATASPECDDGAPYALPSSLLSAGLGDTATAAASTTAFVTWCDQQIAAGRGGPGGRRDEWESLPTLWPWIVRSIRVAAAIAAAAAAARSGAGGSRTQRAGASSPLADVRVPATVEHHTAASTKVGKEAMRELLEKTDFLRGRKPEKLLSVAFGAAAAAGHVSEAGRAERRHEKERHALVSDAPHPVMQQQEVQSQAKQLARPNWSQARSDDDPSTAGRSDKSVAPSVPLLPHQRASGAPPAVPTPPRAAAEARPMVPLPPTTGADTAAATFASSGPRAPNVGLYRAATPVQPATRSSAPSTQASGRRGQRSRSVSFTAEEFPSGEQGEGAAAADDVQPTGISPLEAAALYGGAPVVAEGGGSAASDPTAPNYRDFYRENVVDVRSHGPHVTPPSVPPVPATAAASSRFAASSRPAVPTAPPAPGPTSAKPPVPLLSLLMGGGSGGGSSGPTANLGGSSVHLPGADGADAARVAAAEPSPSYGGTISLDTSPVFVSASRGAPASPGAAGAVSRGPPSTAIVGADSVGTSATVPPLAPGTVVAARPPPPVRGGRPGSSSGTPLIAAAGAVDDSVTAGAPSRRTPSGGRVERRPKVPALPDHTGGPVGFGLTSATVPAMPSPRQPAVTMVTVDVGTPVDADQAREVQIELVVPAVRDDYPTEGTLNQMNARGRERRQKLQLDRMRREDAEARGWQQQQRLPPSGAPPVVPSLAAIAKRPTGPPAPPLPPGNAAQRSAPVRDLQDALPTGGSGWM